MTPLSRTVTQWRGDLAKIRNIIDAIRADVDLDKLNADWSIRHLSLAHEYLSHALSPKKKKRR
jgi:hypothetical protein